MKFLFFIFLVIQTLQTASAAPVYKWVDEDGQIHYGSKPKSENAKEIEIKNKYIDTGSSAPALSAEERSETLKRFVDSIDEENESKADNAARMFLFSKFSKNANFSMTKETKEYISKKGIYVPSKDLSIYACILV